MPTFLGHAQTDTEDFDLAEESSLLLLVSSRLIRFGCYTFDTFIWRRNFFQRRRKTESEKEENILRRIFLGEGIAGSTFGSCWPKNVTSWSTISLPECWPGVIIIVISVFTIIKSLLQMKRGETSIISKLLGRNMTNRFNQIIKITYLVNSRCADWVTLLTLSFSSTRPTWSTVTMLASLHFFSTTI